MREHKLIHSLIFCLLFLLLTIGVFGQTARLTGIVSDETGAVLPGVEITLTNQDTNVVRTALSGDTGDYTLTGVTIGTYTVTAELVGFKRYVQPDLELTVNQVARIDIKLSIGEIQQEIQSRRNREWIGREVEILVEGRSRRDPRRVAGRTTQNRVVNVLAPDASPGDYLRARIVGSGVHHLKGRLLEGVSAA